MLYDRDYRVLSFDEHKEWQEVEAKFKASNVNKNSNLFGYTAESFFKYLEDLPLAAKYHKTLFPNNYLDTDELEDAKRIEQIKNDFIVLLASDPKERDVLNFIRNNKAYFIIGTIFQEYNFGHHIAFAFKEFELPPDYIADYLLVGKNSGGYEFIFVELESPSGSIINADGMWGGTIRKGIKQIEDWNTWIECNFVHLKLVFNKYVPLFILYLMSFQNLIEQGYIL